MFQQSLLMKSHSLAESLYKARLSSNWIYMIVDHQQSYFEFLIWTYTLYYLLNPLKSQGDQQK